MCQQWTQLYLTQSADLSVCVLGDAARGGGTCFLSGATPAKRPPASSYDSGGRRSSHDGNQPAATHFLNQVPIGYANMLQQ